MVILTKYGNTVAISTKDHKVVFMSIKSFLSAFSFDRVAGTVTMDTDLVDVKDIPLAEWEIAGNTGLATVDDLGNAIADLVKLET